VELVDVAHVGFESSWVRSSSRGVETASALVGAPSEMLEREHCPPLQRVEVQEMVSTLEWVHFPSLQRAEVRELAEGLVWVHCLPLQGTEVQELAETLEPPPLQTAVLQKLKKLSETLNAGALAEPQKSYCLAQLPVLLGSLPAC